MNKLKILIILTMIMLGLTGCQSPHEKTTSNYEDVTNMNNAQVLVAYFSLYGNAPYSQDVDASTSASIVINNNEKIGATEFIANSIANKTGGDIHLIQVKDQYSTDFNDVRERNHSEQADETYPSLVSSDLNMDDYDIVFIGYPIWSSTIPDTMRSFIKAFDFTGKTVIPFCTHDGYGSGKSYQDIKSLVKEANVLEGLAIESNEILSSQNQLEQWLVSLGIDLKNETLQLSIKIGNHELEGVLNDSSEAKQFKKILPQTISMVHYGNREYYGGIDEHITTDRKGQLKFDNGDITYCPTNNTIAIFYNQSDKPDLTMEVYVIGKVTSDLSLFNELNSNEDIIFSIK